MTTKVAWVTGGTRGLGLAVARAFADDGAAVAVSARDAERAKRMARQEEVVGAVLYLASDGASYTTGTSITIDGGWSAG